MNVQATTASKVDKMTGITNSVGTAWATPTYDGAGHMIGMPTPPASTTGATPEWVPMPEAQWNTLTESQWNSLSENTGTTPQALSAQYDAWDRLMLITNGTLTLSHTRMVIIFRRSTAWRSQCRHSNRGA